MHSCVFSSVVREHFLERLQDPNVFNLGLYISSNWSLGQGSLPWRWLGSVFKTNEFQVWDRKWLFILDNHVNLELFPMNVLNNYVMSLWTAGSSVPKHRCLIALAQDTQRLLKTEVWRSPSFL